MKNKEKIFENDNLEIFKKWRSTRSRLKKAEIKYGVARCTQHLR